MEAAFALLREQGVSVQMLAATLILAYVLYKVLHRAFVPQFAGPLFTWPFIGETVEFFKCPSRFLFQRYLKYGGKNFRSSFLGMDVYVMVEPESARSIMLEDKERPQDLHFHAPGSAFPKLLGSISYMQLHDQHTVFRRMHTIALGPANMAKMIADLRPIVERHINLWSKQGSMALGSAAKNLSFDFATEVITGVPLDGLDKDWLRVRFLTFVAGLYTPLPLNVPGTALHTALRAKRELLQALEPIISRELEAFRAKTGPEPNCKPEDLQSLLWAQLGAAKPFHTLTVDLALSRALGNIIAAGDTTRYAMYVCLAAVALSGRAQEMLREEQKQALAAHGDELSLRVLSSLPYLDACVKEALRLMPASSGGFRRTLRPVKVGALTVPKGAVMYWATHLPHLTDPVVMAGNKGGSGGFDVGRSGLPAHMDFMDRFEEAFRPERWLSDDMRPRNFFTFGYGTHQCPGMNLALAEVKLVLASLTRRFTLAVKDKDILRKSAWFPGPACGKTGSDVLLLTPAPM